MTEATPVDRSTARSGDTKRIGVLALLVVLFAVSVVAALRVNEQFTPDSRYYSRDGIPLLGHDRGGGPRGNRGSQ